MATITSERRNDPAIRADEVELTPATIAQRPRRFSVAQASDAVREFRREETKLATEISERQIVLSEMRKRALEVQDKFEGMIAERAGLTAKITAAGAELEVNVARLQELEAWVESNWNKPLADHEAEYSRRLFLTSRLPAYIKKWNSELAGLEKQIADFASEHGIPT